MLVAWCQLRNDRRTFKLDRVVRMVQMDMPPLVIPVRDKTRGAAKIYGAADHGAQIYDRPDSIPLTSLSLHIDLPVQTASATPFTPPDLTIPANPS